MTEDELRQILPSAGHRAGVFVDALNSSMDEFAINTPPRQAAFIAQIGHESGSLHYVRELASGGPYEGRADLGNTEPGDGPLYKGRGLIQITGRANYEKCGAALGLDLIAAPALLEEPENASRSAGWFWQTHGLNEIADAGDFVKITKRINGGTTGLADREAIWARARAVLGC